MKELEMEERLSEKKQRTVDAVTKIMHSEGQNVETSPLRADRDGQIANGVTVFKKYCKKKRKAPPPPTAIILNIDALSNRANFTHPVSPSVESTQKEIAPDPPHKCYQQNAIGNGDTSSIENIEPAEIQCSVSELSLGNPFHPLYDQQVHNVSKQISKTSINESCSDLSLDNPFHPLYDDSNIGTQSVTESVSDLSLTNPFHPLYEEITQQKMAIKTNYRDNIAAVGEDEFDDHRVQVVTKKNKLASRVKEFFLSLLPCIRMGDKDNK